VKGRRQGHRRNVCNQMFLAFNAAANTAGQQDTAAVAKMYLARNLKT